MSLRDCQECARSFVVAGWSEVRIGNWLVDNGYKANGITAKRICRYYVDQIARG